jgi:hypothetical protein
MYAGGLRLGGFDTGNTIWNGNTNMGITVNSGYTLSLGMNGGNGAIMTINNTSATISQPTTINASLNIGGILTVLKNNWILSSDSILRIYFQNDGTTFFHSGNTNGDGFIFRNTAQGDIVTITDTGNITNTGSITSGSGSYIYAGGLRIGGFDGNTLYQTGNIGISANTGSTISFNMIGGNGNIVSINNTSATITQPTTINSSLTVSADINANTFVTSTAYNNNIVLKTNQIYPTLSGSGGYYLIDVYNYAQGGYCYIQLSVSSYDFYWLGRVFVQGGSSISFVNDWYSACSTGYLTNAGRLCIKITPSTGPGAFQLMNFRIIG